MRATTTSSSASSRERDRWPRRPRPVALSPDPVSILPPTTPVQASRKALFVPSRDPSKPSTSSLLRRSPRTRRRSGGEIFGVTLAAVIVVVVSAATSIPAFRLLRRARTGLASGWELMSTPRVCVRFLRLPSVVRGHRDSAAGWAIVASLSRWVPSPQPSSRSAASRFDRQREIGRRPHRFDSGHGARGS